MKVQKGIYNYLLEIFSCSFSFEVTHKSSFLTIKKVILVRVYFFVFRSVLFLEYEKTNCIDIISMKSKKKKKKWIRPSQNKGIETL